MYTPRQTSIPCKTRADVRVMQVTAIVVIAVCSAPAADRAYSFDEDESLHCAQFYIPFNGRDFALGLEYRFEPPGTKRVSLFTLFAARPYHKKALEHLRPHFTLIYREVRYHAGAGIQAAIPLGSGVSAHTGVGLAFTFGDYAGTHRQPEQGWTPLVRAGITYAPIATPLIIQAGYQYADLKSAGSSWGFFNAGVRF